MSGQSGGPSPSIAPSHTGSTLPAADPIPQAAPAKDAASPVTSTTPPEKPVAAPVPAQNVFDHDPLADNVRRNDDGWYDDQFPQEMVTVIYDHETGQIQQAFTDDGEDITHEFDDYGLIQPGQPGAQPAEGDGRVQDLEQMAKAVSLFS